MAWVEAKGSGFRVRHRRADGTIDTESGFASRPAARKRAREINEDQAENCARTTARPDAPHAEPTLAGVPETPFAEPITSVRQHAAPATIPPFSHPLAAGQSANSPTLAAFTATWIRDHRIAPNTAAKYDSHLRHHILPAFGAIPLDAITRTHVKAWANHIYANMASSSADTILSLLSTILNEAVLQRLIPVNPCKALRVERTSPQEKAHATPLQILQIAARMDAANALLVITAAYTGMRWGELTGLAWDNVQLDQEQPEISITPEESTLHEISGRLWLDEPKTNNSVRRVALPPFLTDTLRSARNASPTDFVFTAERGGWLRRTNFRTRTWEPALRGIPDHPDPQRRTPIVPGMTFHGLRHTHKTWMIEEDIPEIVQDKRLGHATPGIGARYSHVTAPMLHDLCTKLENRYQISLTHFRALGHSTDALAA